MVLKLCWPLLSLIFGTRPCWSCHKRAVSFLLSPFSPLTTPCTRLLQMETEFQALQKQWEARLGTNKDAMAQVSAATTRIRELEKELVACSRKSFENGALAVLCLCLCRCLCLCVCALLTHSHTFTLSHSHTLTLSHSLTLSPTHTYSFDTLFLPPPFPSLSRHAQLGALHNCSRLWTMRATTECARTA